MLNNSIQYTIPAGEKRELFLLNEPTTNYHIIQEEGSSLLIHVIALPSPHDDNYTQHTSITVEHNAANCRTEIFGLALLHGSQQNHLTTRVLHNVGEGYSSQLIKFVLDDASKASFKGELKILPDAQHVEAYQTNRNILLSRRADMVTEPQLEIYADDVKASHGATTGQLDDSALFYMQQRCISRESARKLLLCAFFDDVLRTLPDEQMQETILEKINDYIG
jgi:Fe-S cluster assembly protein SufD